MKKVIFLNLFLLTSMFAFGQFNSDIERLTDEGHYFLGTFNLDSINFCNLYLEEDIDIKKIKSFYIILVSSDTTDSFDSGGGQNNFLWTDEVKKTTILENKLYALINIYWKFSEERFRNHNKYLGAFTIRVIDNNTKNTYCNFVVQLRCK
jgi:hypothetical protein